MPTDKNTTTKNVTILSAALSLIAENGFHHTPVSLIAKKAGVGAGTIYRYFRDKDELIHALFEHVEGRLRRAFMEKYDAEVSIRKRFFHLWTSIFVHLMSNPMEFKFLEQYYNSPYGIPVRRERLLSKSKQDPVTRLFEVGRKQRIFKDFPLPVLFALAIGPIVLLMRDHHAGFLVLDQATIRNTVEGCWDSIRQ
jgi:AcrR family transcriptional regulator